MEHFTSFVGSRSILKSCSRHNAAPLSSNSQLDVDLLSRLHTGDTIYVCTDALENFATYFLPQLNIPFFLVSGDSDTPVSEALVAQAAIAGLLASPLLQHWHAQNLACKHPKISALPIGLDYHTMWQRPGTWGLSAISPMAQEHLLQQTLSESPRIQERYLEAYCNWHFEMQRGDRQQCFDEIEHSACFFEAARVPRLATWQRQAECMFVISPEGAGMDCHRTWEALLLGCIPVIKRNALSPLFELLPVMQVDSWREVTRESLMNFYVQALEQRYDFSALFLQYWVAKVHGRVPRPIGQLKIAEFRQLISRRTG